MATKDPALKKQDVQEYLDLNERRLEAQRKADDFEKLAKVLKARIWQHVKAKGGRKRSCTLSGFLLEIRKKAGNPAWKEEFLRVAGQVAAAKIVAKTPKKDYLVVEPKV